MSEEDKQDLLARNVMARLVAAASARVEPPAPKKPEPKPKMKAVSSESSRRQDRLTAIRDVFDMDPAAWPADLVARVGGLAIEAGELLKRARRDVERWESGDSRSSSVEARGTAPAAPSLQAAIRKRRAGRGPAVELEAARPPTTRTMTAAAGKGSAPPPPSLQDRVREARGGNR